jgi:Tol biopolymer transport system component
MWDLAGDKPALRVQEENVIGVDFSPDGRRMILANLDGTLNLYATDTGVRTKHLAASDLKESGGGPAFHPKEPYVAIASYGSQLLQVRDLRNGAVTFSQTPYPWGCSGCVWSPDGRTLAVSANNMDYVQLYAFDPTNGSLHFTRVLKAQATGTGGMEVALAQDC